MTLSIRAIKLFGEYDLAGKRGLEFGALSRPFLKDVPGVRMSYADHLSTEGIKEKYKGNSAINQADIVDVSYVVDGVRRLSEIIPDRFDFALGCHVAEHVPDLLGWWYEIAELLTDDGQIALVIPDKRRCFDVARPLSTTAEVVGAWLEQRKKPNAASAFAHGACSYRLNNMPAWQFERPLSELQNMSDLKAALARARSAVRGYVDTHCWVFTPESFQSIISDLSELGVLPFRVVHFEVPPQDYHAEFYVRLERTAPAAA